MATRQDTKSKKPTTKQIKQTNKTGDGKTKSKVEEVRGKLDLETLKRTKPLASKKSDPSPPSVSAGAVEKAMDLAFNPTREKIREVTIIDRMQGRMFPQLDMVNSGRQYCLEIAFHRQDPVEYERKFDRPRPIPPDLLDELLFRTAQWQKSVAGRNLERITDIALAETEVRAGDEDITGENRDAWKE